VKSLDTTTCNANAGRVIRSVDVSYSDCFFFWGCSIHIEQRVGISYFSLFLTPLKHRRAKKYTETQSSAFYSPHFGCRSISRVAGCAAMKQPRRQQLLNVKISRRTPIKPDQVPNPDGRLIFRLPRASVSDGFNRVPNWRLKRECRLFKAWSTGTGQFGENWISVAWKLSDLWGLVRRCIDADFRNQKVIRKRLTRSIRFNQIYIILRLSNRKIAVYCRQMFWHLSK